MFLVFLNMGDWVAESIPIIKPLVTIELPPVEINGIVTPVKGIILHEPNILRAICTVNAEQIQAEREAW